MGIIRNITVIYPLSDSNKSEINNWLKSDSHLPKNLCYLLHLKPFQNHEKKKAFLFRLKSSFRSKI